MHIVLAEDDAALRELLTSTRAGHGHRVTAVSDGHELLELVAKNLRANGHIADVDLIVSDMRMPQFTGIDAAVGLRRVLAVTPFILITAFGDENTHEYAKSLGVSAVLDKPFDLDDFLATVCPSWRRCRHRTSLAQARGRLWHCPCWKSPARTPGERALAGLYNVRPDGRGSPRARWQRKLVRRT